MSERFRWWIDKANQPHKVSEMSDEHVLNVIHYFCGKEPSDLRMTSLRWVKDEAIKRGLVTRPDLKGYHIPKED